MVPIGEGNYEKVPKNGGASPSHVEGGNAPRGSVSFSVDRAWANSSHVSSADNFAGASSASAAFNLSASLVGPTIMSLPATLRVLGLPLGLIFLIAVGILTQLSVEMLIKATVAQQALTYSDLVGQVHGRRARYALDVSAVVVNFSLCAEFLIIVGDVLCGGWSGSRHHTGGILEAWNAGQPAWWTTRAWVIFVLLALLALPIFLFKHIDTLHYGAAVSMLLALGFVITLLVLCGIKGAAGELSSPALVPTISSADGAMEFLATVAVIATSYVCHFNLHPIYAELRDKTEGTMVWISRSASLFAGFLYVAASVAGYLLFGADTAINVLVNFNGAWSGANFGALNTVISLIYSAHVLLEFPVVFYALRAITDDLLFPNTQPLVSAPRRFLLLTTLGLAAVYGFSVLVPNVWVAANLLGATGIMVVGMIFPGTLALRDRSGAIARWEKILAHFLVLFGVIVSLCSLVSSIFFLATGDAEGP